MSFKIECIKIKENKDGSETYTFEINQEAKKFITKYYNEKRFSKKLFQKFFEEAIKFCLNKKKGE